MKRCMLASAFMAISLTAASAQTGPTPFDYDTMDRETPVFLFDADGGKCDADLDHAFFDMRSNTAEVRSENEAVQSADFLIFNVQIHRKGMALYNVALRDGGSPHDESSWVVNLHSGEITHIVPADPLYQVEERKGTIILKPCA